MTIAPRIRIMPPLLANQIAAGEVVERPASVVKELLENCLDAHATQIHIDLDHSGIERIRIRDDGNGIIKDDLMLALSRHATSKIAHPDDLYTIKSLGFRGEALASIAAIAKVNLISRPPATEHAWSVHHDPSQPEPTLQPAAHPPGTTIEVENLFFNVPVRRKFLRSDRTELGHIETVVKQLALARPDVHIVLKHQQSTLLNAKRATNTAQIRQRLAAICGQPFIDKALTVDVADKVLRLHGWLGQADTARTQTDTQYFYVNGRIVRDKLLNHAVKMAYHDCIPEGRHPCYVLYLELPPDAVDVNVHPTKHEVRFYESRHVHDFVAFHLDRALHGNHFSTTADTDQPVAADEPQEMAFLLASGNLSPAPALTVKETAAPYHRSAPFKSYPPLMPATTVIGEAAVLTPVAIKPHTSMPPLPEFKLIGLTQQQYLLVEQHTDLLIIHIERARQAIAYNHLLTASAEQPLIGQPLLLPMALTLNSHQSDVLDTLQPHLRCYGIQLNRVTEQRWLIRELPSVLKMLDTTQAIMQLTESSGEFNHHQCCLQLAKHSLLPTTFSATLTLQTETIQALLALPDWQQHRLKPCRIIKLDDNALRSVAI